MRKLPIAFALLLLASDPAAHAASRVCTNGMVTQGVCRVNTNVLIAYDAPVAVATKLAKAVAAQNGCIPVVPEATPPTCTTTCTPALAKGGACAVGAVGTTVTITMAVFADATIWLQLVTYIRQYDEEQAVAPVRATSRATADPDISN